MEGGQRQGKIGIRLLFLASLPLVCPQFASGMLQVAKLSMGGRDRSGRRVYNCTMDDRKINSETVQQGNYNKYQSNGIG